MIKRILVGLGDLPHVQVSISMAIDLARTHQASLTGVTLFDPESLDDVGPVPVGGGVYAADLRESRTQAAQQEIAAAADLFTTACREAGVDHQLVNETGDPLTQLAAHYRYHDLLICGLHGLFRHGAAQEPADLMVRVVEAGVRPLIAVSAVERPIKRVLIAYSGSMESAKTMKRFVQLGLWREASLRLVNFDEDAVRGERTLVDAAEYLTAHGLKPQCECVRASAHDHLLGYAAQTGTDLIVMGNSARNLLLRRMFGETALHTIRNANLPLFLAQ